MSLYRHLSHHVPGLNTASLPDLIFSVLFFFMIVTHIKKSDVKVKYRMPQANELTRLTHRSTTTYIYVGRPSAASSSDTTSMVIQINDHPATVNDVGRYVNAARNNLHGSDRKRMSISLRADKHAPMGTISDIKMQLRRAKALNINYEGEKVAETANKR